MILRIMCNSNQNITNQLLLDLKGFHGEYHGDYFCQPKDFLKNT
jgi:hypothetical protein